MFGEVLRRSSALHGILDAVVFGEHRLTYAQLYDRACRLASGLINLGIRPGDRVATLGDNHLESIEEICGIALAGAVRTPMYTQNTAEVHLYMLRLTGARALVIEEKYYLEIASKLSGAPDLEVVIVHGDAQGDAVGYDALLAESPATDPGVRPCEDDTHIIRFSAGTTGRPKGIAHSWRGWAGVGNELALMLPRLNPGDAQLVVGPLSHIACLPLWPMIAHGVRTVVMPAFDAGETLRLIEREGIKFVVLVPTMIQMIVNHRDAKSRDVSSLDAVLYGGSPIAVRTLLDAQALWGNVMYQLYGQSECVPATMLTPRCHVVDGTQRERRWLRSAGVPGPNTFVRILDDEDQECPPGEVGEIVLSSPGAMQGIWRDDAATASRMIDGRWVRTRDLGYLDADGFLFLADRKEDMIISGGFNIWPAEVEDALISHPAVLEAAVVGVPDEKWGETVRAVVVLRDGHWVTEQELIDWCRTKIGSIKKPTGVVFQTEPLPKSGVGKMLRRVVREQYWREAERQISGS